MSVVLFLSVLAANFTAAARVNSPVVEGTGRTVVDVVPILRQCPDERYVLGAGDVCTLREQVEVNKECPPHGKLTNNDTCMVEERYKPEKICPIGSKFDGTDCEITRITPARLICERPGDRLEHGECVRVEEAQSRPTCPKGYLLSKDHERCIVETYEAPDVLCAQGYAPREPGNLCEKLVEVEAVAQCLNDEVLIDGKCAASEAEGLPVQVCAVGTLNEANQCVTIAALKPDNVCPTGFSMSDKAKVCESNETFEPRFKCPKNYILSGRDCVHTIKAERYCDGPNQKLSSVEGVCKSTDTRIPATVCPERSVLDENGKCIIQLIHKDAVLTDTCGEGFIANNGQCYRTTPAALQCPQGYTPGYGHDRRNVCIKKEIQPATIKCPDGFLYEDTQEKCVMTTGTDTVVICPKNGFFNENTKLCEYHKSYPAIAECPPNQSLRKKGLGGVIAECVTKQIVKALQQCPGGGVMDPVADVCVRSHAVPPEGSCPKEYTKSNQPGICERFEEVAAIKKCPLGYKAIGSACVGKVAVKEDNYDKQEAQADTTQTSVGAPAFSRSGVMNNAVTGAKAGLKRDRRNVGGGSSSRRAKDEADTAAELIAGAAPLRRAVNVARGVFGKYNYFANELRSDYDGEEENPELFDSVELVTALPNTETQEMMEGKLQQTTWL